MGAYVILKVWPTCPFTGLAAGLICTVPCMKGWMLQWYGKDPPKNVNLNVCPVDRVGELHKPTPVDPSGLVVSLVVVCGVAAWLLVQTTFVPRFPVTGSGEKAKLAMDTLTVAAMAVPCKKTNINSPMGAALRNMRSKTPLLSIGWLR
jgi:hypothetical protein